MSVLIGSRPLAMRQRSLQCAIGSQRSNMPQSSNEEKKVCNGAQEFDKNAQNESSVKGAEAV